MGRQNYAFSPNFVEIMAKLFLVLLITISILPAIAQKAGTPTIADTALHFADSVFHTRSIEFEQIETGIPTDIQPILARFNNALVVNRSWFEQYKSTYAGQPLPYNSRFGISADEYRRLQSFTPQLIPVDTQKINIIREGGYIRFHGVDSGFQLLDYLQIDLRRLLLIYGADTVPLIGRTGTTAASPYGAWEGFTWRLEKADANSIIASSRVTARVIEINMGLTSPSSPQPFEPAGQSAATQAATPTSQTATQASPPAAGSLPQPASPSNPQNPAAAKVFLRVKYQQMKEGTTTANLEMVGYIRH